MGDLMMSAIVNDGTVSSPRRWWMATLVTVLGIYEVLLSLNSGLTVLVSGVVGGILVALSPWLVRRSTTLGVVLLVVGALVWGIIAWWSIIAPLIAIVALAIGGYLALKSRHLTHYAP
jgi:hypothetical protein